MPLKIDYVDSMFLGNRKYIQTQNPDGSVSFTDATDYEQVGDTFGAADINATNTTVNEIVDGTIEVPKSGNAATATKLATPRTINGVNFDGSAPITITADPTNTVPVNKGGTGQTSLSNVTVGNSDKWGSYFRWVGTQAEYDAISSKNSMTVYFIKG